MTTVATSIRRVLGHVNGQQRILADFLDEAIGASASELTLRYNYAKGLAPGQWIEINREPMLILARSDASFTVGRGLTEATPVGHSAGDTAWLNPPAFELDVMAYLQKEADELPNTIYSVGQLDVTFNNENPYAQMTGLTDDLIDVLWAWVEPTDTSEPIKRVRVRTLPASALTASSVPLIQTMPDPKHFSRGATVHVEYAYTPDVDTGWGIAYDWETNGFSSRIISAIEYGAASRIMMDREAARAQLAGQNADRRSDEVPPQHNATAAEMFRRKQGQLIAKDAARLTGEHGITIQ